MKKFSSIGEWLDYYSNIKCVKTFYTTAIQKSVPNVTLEEVYIECERYRMSKKLNVLYELRCPECYSTIGIYKSISDIPSESTCIKCGYEDMDILNDSIVLYEFIR